jgi:hypothetical protein
MGATGMISAGAEYRHSIRDNPEVFKNGGQIRDIAALPQVKPLLGKVL